jgi:hypothetical protein
MAKNNGLRNAARARTACFSTETHAQAVNILRSLPPGTSRVPSGSEDQARLEGSVWDALCWPHNYLPHPFGIRLVHLDGGTLMIELDSGKVLTEPFVYNLLPRFSHEHGFAGAPGVRVQWDEGVAGITVSSVGTDAKVVLTGVSAADWDQAREELVRESPIDRTFWDCGDALQGDEVAELKDRAGYCRPQVLGSALLRRAAVFHTVSSPHNVTSWLRLCSCRCKPDCGAAMWAIEAFYAPTLPFEERKIVNTYVHSLPLRIDDWQVHSTGDALGRGRSLYIELASDGEPCLGGLQLRLRTWDHQTVEELRLELFNAGLAEVDVDRLAPLESRLGRAPSPRRVRGRRELVPEPESSFRRERA